MAVFFLIQKIDPLVAHCVMLGYDLLGESAGPAPPKRDMRSWRNELSNTENLFTRPELGLDDSKST